MSAPARAPLGAMTVSGRLLFALGLAGIGALSLGSGDFAYTWQPVPAGFAGREVLARVLGALLLAAGAGMLLPRAAVWSVRLVTLYLLSWAVFLHGPPVARAPLDTGAWLGLAENLVLVCGGWALCLELAPGGGGRLSGRGALAALRVLVGGSCLVLGLSHFVYATITAGMVPSWMPARPFLASLTGVAHIAAGLGILLSIVPRLAAALEALMVVLFVLLLHLPGAIGDPSSRLQWTMLFIATALAGALSLVAGSYRCPQAAAPGGD